MADTKTIALVAKLLRVASPKSNASENERQIAAIEAAKLIAENELVVGLAPPPPPARRREPAPARYTDPTPYRPQWQSWPPQPRYSSPDWREGTVDVADWCVICRHPLEVGERAFHCELGWRCYDIACGNTPEHQDL